MSIYDHERPNSLNPSEWELAIVSADGATILISKVGGGTIGREYVGAWHYSWTYRDRHQEGSDLDTPIPTTHYGAAAFISEYVTDEEVI